MVLVFSISALLLLLLAYTGLCLFYWWFQERFIFVRIRLAEDHVFRFKHGHPFEEVWLDGADGARLHGLYFKVPRPRGAVLYFHGNTGSLRRWGKRASRFTALGYDVLMPDYRGYGKSRGALSEAALHEDAARWHAWLTERTAECDIVLYGRSLGTGIAVPLAARTTPRALVLESPYANFTDVAKHYLAILPYRWLLRYYFRSDKAMRRVHCPVYIFHGKRDPIVPYSSALKLYATIPADVHRELISFNKGYHSDLAGFPRFRRKIREILVDDVGDPVIAR